MIGRLRGDLLHKGLDGVVLDVGGIGYEIAMSPRGLAELPGIGSEVVVHTHLHVREDVMALYGFASADDRDLFRVLLGASGVGPKVAMAVLSTLDAHELRTAVTSEDIDLLTTVPGVGKRSAQKLILDLRARLELPDAELIGNGTELAEVREALEGLGYQTAEIRQALDGLDPEEGVEGLLRSALQRLGRS